VSTVLKLGKNFMHPPIIGGGNIMFSLHVCVCLCIRASVRPFTFICPQWMEIL